MPSSNELANRSGWRFFSCQECGQTWKEATRDRFSPSGVDCACCGAWVSPSDRFTEPPVAVDAFGNLLKYVTELIQTGVAPPD